MQKSHLANSLTVFLTIVAMQTVGQVSRWQASETLLFHYVDPKVAPAVRPGFGFVVQGSWRMQGPWHAFASANWNFFTLRSAESVPEHLSESAGAAGIRYEIHPLRNRWRAHLQLGASLGRLELSDRMTKVYGKTSARTGAIAECGFSYEVMEDVFCGLSARYSRRPAECIGSYGIQALNALSGGFSLAWRW